MSIVVKTSAIIMYVQFFLTWIGCTALVFLVVSNSIRNSPGLLRGDDALSLGQWLPDQVRDWEQAFIAAIMQISLWVVGTFVWRVFLAFGYEPSLLQRNKLLFQSLNGVALLIAVIGCYAISLKAMGGALWETSATALYFSLPAMFFVLLSMRTVRKNNQDEPEITSLRKETDSI